MLAPPTAWRRKRFWLRRRCRRAGRRCGCCALQCGACQARPRQALREPGTNLIPNSGFEEQPEATQDKSHWEITLRNHAKSQWQLDAAPEGKVFLTLEGTQANSTASVNPYRPIAAERGAPFTLSFRHKATAAWKWEIAFLPSPSEEARQAVKPETFPIAASAQWQQSETTLTIPAAAPYVSLTGRLDGIGSLDLDDITLKRSAPNPAAGVK